MLNILFVQGLVPTMMRAAVLTSSQLSSYDHTKHMMKKYELMADGPGLHFLYTSCNRSCSFLFDRSIAFSISASAVAGLVTATTTSPIDVIKTRVMNAPPGLYRGPLDCLIKVI